MTKPAAQPSLWESFAEAANAFSGWVEAHRRQIENFSAWVEGHRPEIEALATWGAVSATCRDARLYAPIDAEAWAQIRAELRAEEPDPEAIIISTYGRSGIGFGALQEELLTSPLLADRRRETAEIVDSLADGRHFVAACGALPLVEYVISKSAGKWNNPSKQIEAAGARLRDDDFEFGDDLLLDYAALEMVLSEIPHVWKNGRQQVGAVVQELNRHYILHGTGVGWDDARNATRAVLLLAACARVAGPLFGNAQARVDPLTKHSGR